MKTRQKNPFGRQESSDQSVLQTLGALGAMLLLGGCGANLYSLPFYTSTTMHNEAALRFLKQGGPVAVGSPEEKLRVRDWFEDGKVVAVTASGGGMRATAFTLGVMSELDDLKTSEGGSSALRQTDFLSSVSGGSWAVAAMLVERHEHPSVALSDAMQSIEVRLGGLENAKVKHWANAFIPRVTDNRTFSAIYGPGEADRLPFAYFNASLFPSQSPFVFTPSYLRHYEVRTLGDPANPDRVTGLSEEIGPIPVGYAATASSAVPGYTSAFASTDLCSSKPPRSFCGGKQGSNNLQIFDGGLYDNIGYKTALEVAWAKSDQIRRVPASVIMIDSADDVAYQTVPRSSVEKGRTIALAKAASFPNQNSTFDRLRSPGFAAAGFDRQILLDFSSAAGFDLELDRDKLAGLTSLAYFAAHDVNCFNDDGRIDEGKRVLREPADPGTVAANIEALNQRGGDCVSMNFARAGYLYKTTFKFDAYRFRINYELGRLVVRMHRDCIVEALARTRRDLDSGSPASVKRCGSRLT